MATLERAIEIAVAVTDPDAKIVAVLHDVVEDSRPPNRFGFDDLRAEGFSEAVLAALDCVTAREGEPYEAFVERILPNAVARSVKIADVTDNLDVKRLGIDITDRDVERIRKYRRALAKLQAAHGAR